MNTQFRMARFRFGALQAAAKGDLPVLQWWVTKYLPEQRMTRLVFEAAAGNGQVHVIQWLYEHSSSHFLDERVVTTMAQTHPDVILWLDSLQLPFPLRVSMDAAVKAGDLEFVKWLHSNQDRFTIDCRTEAMTSAATAGRLDLLQWLHSNYRDVFDQWIQFNISGFGHLHIMQWLHATHPEANFVDPSGHLTRSDDHKAIQWLLDHCQWRSDVCRLRWISCVMRVAIKRGDLGIVQCLWPHFQFKTSSDTIRVAASNGHLELVKWLYENGATRDQRIIDDAANGGHLEIVKWLHTNQPQSGCTANAMDLAVDGNHMHVVQWLHEHRTEGCSTLAMDWAAARGNFEMVQWLHENRKEGCTVQAMNDAATNGYLDIVKWLHENRSEGCTTEAMDSAASNGHLQDVRWLHEHRLEGCMTSAMDSAAEKNHFEIVEFLHANRSEGCSTSAMNKAAANGYLTIVEWLHAHQSEGCTTFAMNQATINGHLEVIKFLTRHRYPSVVQNPWQEHLKTDTFRFESGFNGINMGQSNTEGTKKRKLLLIWRRLMVRFMANNNHSTLSTPS